MPGTNSYIWDGDYAVANASDQVIELPTEYFNAAGNLKRLYGFIVVFNGKAIETPTYDYVDGNGDLISDASAVTGGNTSVTAADLVGSYKFSSGSPLECYSFKLKLKVLGASSTYVKIKKVIFTYRVIHDEPGTL